jgi:hypothetical protein
MEATETEGMPSTHAQAVIDAHEAAVRRAEFAFVMCSPVRVWDLGSTFNHLFLRLKGSAVSLCGKSVAGAQRMASAPVAQLHQVDCLACLEAFTERTRPRG